MPPPALVLTRTRGKPKKTVRFASDTKEVDTYAVSARKYRGSHYATIPKPAPPPSRQQIERIERVREETIYRARASHMSRSWMY